MGEIRTSFGTLSLAPMLPSTSRVLVVDDAEGNRNLARRALEPAGHTVLMAESGAEALELFAREQVDLVLLDAMMPGLDGFETCARLRALPGGPETPIIFLTALDGFDAHKKALAAGADDYLVKPIRPSDLVIRVRGLLRLRAAMQEAESQRDLARRQHDELQTLQKQKEELTALIIHDLKTPLAVLNLEAEFALDSAGVPAEVRECLVGMHDSIDTMRRMVVDLLDINRAETGALVLHRTRVDLRDMVDRVVATLHRRIAEKAQELELVVENAVVDVDRDLFRRVLENLVDNACKYTNEGGRIVISASRREEQVHLEVKDQGPGIPLEARSRIFEKYVQLGERRHRHSRGLGLTFCKLAIEAHGGQIWVADNAPKGARFCIDLAASA